MLDELSHTDQQRSLASPGYARPPLQRNEDRLGRVLGYLHDHAADPIGLADAARVAGMSSAAFCRFFRRNTGRTLTEYIQLLRVGRAQALLRDTELTVSEVAYASGFGNLAHFHRCFRCHTGVTPTAYRSAWRATDPRSYRRQASAR